jgi:hypothetical protein
MAVQFRQQITGNPTTQVLCGEPYTFEVTGYAQVHLWLSKDGTAIYDAPFTVPMPDYIASCTSEVGHYEAVAFDVNTGEEIGRTILDVLPNPSIPSGGIGSIFANIPMPVLLVGGFILLKAFSKKKRR